LRFAGAATALALLLALAGVGPTRRLAGDAATAAVWAGCLASLAASLLGGLVVVGAWRRGAVAIVGALGAVGVRLLVVVLAGVAVALSGLAPVKPLLLWLALSHGVLLVIDTRFALAIAGSRGSAEDREAPGRETPDRETTRGSSTES
jgi:hypothetical protein